MTQSDTTTQPHDSDPWPPASMQQLVTMCTTPALIGLGIVPPPGQEEPALDLPLARHFIDLLALLDEKTSDQLDDADQQALDRSLHELRMAFVQIQQSTDSQTATSDGTAGTQLEATVEDDSADDSHTATGDAEPDTEASGPGEPLVPDSSGAADEDV